MSLLRFLANQVLVWGRLAEARPKLAETWQAGGHRFMMVSARQVAVV